MREQPRRKYGMEELSPVMENALKFFGEAHRHGLPKASLQRGMTHNTARALVRRGLLVKVGGSYGQFQITKKGLESLKENQDGDSEDRDHGTAGR